MLLRALTRLDRSGRNMIRYTIGEILLLGAAKRKTAFRNPQRSRTETNHPSTTPKIAADLAGGGWDKQPRHVVADDEISERGSKVSAVTRRALAKRPIGIR